MGSSFSQDIEPQTPKEESTEIYVKFILLNGKTIPIEVNKNEKIKSAIKKIEEKENLEIKKPEIVYKQQKLDLEETFAKYMIMEEDEIHISY